MQDIQNKLNSLELRIIALEEAIYNQSAMQIQRRPIRPATFAPTRRVPQGMQRAARQRGLRRTPSGMPTTPRRM